MCTAMTYRQGENTYFGRNLDVEFSFHEKVVITPRQHLFSLVNGDAYRTRYAIIGMAAVMENTPLYYEGANEKGLCMAGLNFPGNAVYHKAMKEKDNIALFEIVPWILGQAATVREAKTLLEKLNLTDTMFLGKIPSTPLHFMISDREQSIVVEPVAEGLKLYENPYDVMTNNPTFPYHLAHMHDYLNLSPKNRENTFSTKYDLQNYGVGMGAIGLPGDASSASRFVRCAFHLGNSVSDGTQMGDVTQFFHVLDSVAMVKGATLTDSGKNDITLYSCCIHAETGTFYYKTYDCNTIHAVKMQDVDLDADTLYIYELPAEQKIIYQN